MMVEAGGTERSFQFYAEGAPKVTEEVLADGLEAAKRWIRESINLQRELVAGWTAERGPIKRLEFATLSDYGEDVFSRVAEVGAESLSSANTVTPKAAREDAVDAATRSVLSSLAEEF